MCAAVDSHNHIKKEKPVMHVRKVLKLLGILLNGKKTAKSIAISGNN